ncbi:MAG: hypothetical protein HQL77_18360 [Magnetococcales bacterium]|nr:hypothetical protein [Magnetococcales bacterium]
MTFFLSNSDARVAKFNLLAVIETLIAVVSFFLIILFFDAREYLLISVILPPLLLMRSDQSIKMGISLFLASRENNATVGQEVNQGQCFQFIGTKLFSNLNFTMLVYSFFSTGSYYLIMKIIMYFFPSDSLMPQVQNINYIVKLIILSLFTLMEFYAISKDNCIWIVRIPIIIFVGIVFLMLAAGVDDISGVFQTGFIAGLLTISAATSATVAGKSHNAVFQESTMLSVTEAFLAVSLIAIVGSYSGSLFIDIYYIFPLTPTSTSHIILKETVTVLSAFIAAMYAARLNIFNYVYHRKATYRHINFFSLVLFIFIFVAGLLLVPIIRLGNITFQETIKNIIIKIAIIVQNVFISVFDTSAMLNSQTFLIVLAITALFSILQYNRGRQSSDLLGGIFVGLVVGEIAAILLRLGEIFESVSSLIVLREYGAEVLDTIIAFSSFVVVYIILGITLKLIDLITDKFERYMNLPFNVLGIFGIYIKAFCIRSFSVLKHCEDGVKSAPSNWERSIYVVNSRHPPEIMPGADDAGIYTFRGILNEFNKTTNFYFRFLFIVMMVLFFVPSFLYRLYLKSVSLLYLPLIFLIWPMDRLNNEETAKKWLGEFSGKWAERKALLYTFIIIMFALPQITRLAYISKESFPFEAPFRSYFIYAFLVWLSERNFWDILAFIFSMLTIIIHAIIRHYESNDLTTHSRTITTARTVIYLSRFRKIIYLVQFAIITYYVILLYLYRNNIL